MQCFWSSDLFPWGHTKHVPIDATCRTVRTSPFPSPHRGRGDWHLAQATITHLCKSHLLPPLISVSDVFVFLVSPFFGPSHFLFFVFLFFMQKKNGFCATFICFVLYIHSFFRISFFPRCPPSLFFISCPFIPPLIEVGFGHICHVEKPPFSSVGCLHARSVGENPVGRQSPHTPHPRLSDGL